MNRFVQTTFILCLLNSIFSISLQCQKVIAFDSFFFGSLNETGEDDSNISDKFDPGWIDEIEFRTETDEFELDRQRYTLRFTPSSKRINSSIRELANAQNSKFIYLENELQKKYINDSYKNTIAFYELYLEEKLLKQLLTNLKDQNTVYQKLLTTKNSYSVRWLDVRNEISELESELFINAQRKAYLNPGKCTYRLEFHN